MVDPANGHAVFGRRDLLKLLAASSAVAMAPPLTAHAQRKPSVLRVSALANPSSLDPPTGFSGGDQPFLWPIYDTLTEWDYETLKPKPGQASWTFTDPRTMVLTISPNIRFHDGTLLDADAVKFNLDRGMTDPRSNVKSDLGSISSVDVTGPLTVTVKLKSPDTALPAILSDRAGMMVSPTHIKSLDGAPGDRKPVGAGPYKFVSWADNERVVLTRNPDYWRSGQRYLDGIDFAIITELATGLRSVVAGQNDLVYALPPRLQPVITRAKDLTIATGPTLACIELFFNYAKPPLNNPKVRQAINYALDRDVFVKAALSGLGEVAHMMLPQSHWAFDKSLVGLYPHDPVKARKLLAEAGFPDGLELNAGGYNDQDWVQRSEIVQNQLEKAGFRVKITRGTIVEISAQYFGTEKKYDALISAWSGRPDPSMSYAINFGAGAYNNAGRGATPEMATLLQATRDSEDLGDRAKAFATLQRYVMENALFAPIAFVSELTALSSKVQGYKPDLLGKPKFDDVRLG